MKKIRALSLVPRYSGRYPRHGFFALLGSHKSDRMDAMFKRAFYILVLFSMFSPFQGEGKARAEMAGAKKGTLRVRSAVFDQGGMIPTRYTCDGVDVSPPLAWGGVPEGTKSVALICDDPDAPGGTWVHWVLFNLSADTDALAESVPTRQNLDNGARQGKNDFGKWGYGGPCPPKGTHRYYFKVYALDRMLNLDADTKKAHLVKAMEGHILAEGEIMGRYAR
jgi:Raf kinase inhibitor-like YbhB/YbcL family protein